MEEIKNRFREFMNVYGYNPTSLAKKAGMSRSAISKMLNDHNISLTLVWKVSVMHPEIRMEWLIRGDGTMLSDDDQALLRDVVKKLKRLIDSGRLKDSFDHLVKV